MIEAHESVRFVTMASRSYRALSTQCGYQCNSNHAVDQVEVMELCVPMDIYVDCAVSFSQFHPERLLNFQLHYTLIIQIMAWLTCETFDSPTDKIRLICEKVEDKRDPNKVVAMRLRLIYQSTTSIGSRIGDKMQQNKEDYVKDLKSNKPPRQKLAFERMTMEDWRKACHALASVESTLSDHAFVDSITDTSSLYYPTEAFSVGKSLLYAERLNACIEQCVFTNYVELDASTQEPLRYRYAKMSVVYRISSSEFKPHSYHRFEFPWIKHPDVVESQSKHLFMRLNSIDNIPAEVAANNPAVQAMYHAARQEARSNNEEDDQQQETDFLSVGFTRKRRLVNPRTAEETYNQCMTLLPERDTVLTLELLQLAMKQRKREIETMKQHQSVAWRKLTGRESHNRDDA